MNNEIKSAAGKTSGPVSNCFKFITSKGNTVFNFYRLIFLMTKDRKILTEREAEKINFSNRIAWAQAMSLKVKLVVVEKSERMEVLTLLKRDRPGLAIFLSQIIEEDAKKHPAIIEVKTKLNNGDRPRLPYFKPGSMRKWYKDLGVSEETILERKKGEALRFAYSTEGKENKNEE